MVGPGIAAPWRAPMTLTLDLVLLIVAFLCFVAAALGVASRINLLAVGLAAWVLTVIV